MSCSLPCDGVVEAVLNHRIEIPCRWGVPVIVYAALGVDVRNLLPNTAFACSDGAYSFEQFTEVVFSEYCCALLQALVIHCETFLDILIEYLCCPLAKTGGF